MANGYGTTGSAGTVFNETHIFYNKRALERFKPNMVMDKFAQKSDLPTQKGGVAQWFRLDSMSPTTPLTPLTELSNPTSTDVVMRKITAEPLTYGQVVKTSVELETKQPTTLMDEIQDELMLNGNRVHEILQHTALHGNVVNQFAAGAVAEANVLATSYMNSAELRKGIVTLESVDAVPFDSAFALVIHPRQKHDLIGDTATGGYLDLKKNHDSEPFEKNKLGRLWGADVYVSSLVRTGTGDSAGVTYRAFLLSKGALGATTISGEALKQFTFSQGNTENPLALYSTIGWRLMFAAKSLYYTTGNPRAVEIITGASSD